MRRLFSSLAVLVILVASQPTMAIPVTNHEFLFDIRSPQWQHFPGLGSVVFATPNGWSTDGVAGTIAFQSGGVAIAPGGHKSHANVLGFLSEVGSVGNGSLYQSVTSINADTGFTFSFDIGNRLDAAGFTQSEVRLFVNDLSNVIKTKVLSNPGEGYFNRQSISISGDDLAAYVGGTLGIAFTKLSGIGGLLIDDVQYNTFSSPVTPVPAPAAVIIMLMGLALMARPGMRRKP